MIAFGAGVLGLVAGDATHASALRAGDWTLALCGQELGDCLCAVALVQRTFGGGSPCAPTNGRGRGRGTGGEAAETGRNQPGRAGSRKRECGRGHAPCESESGECPREPGAKCGGDGQDHERMPLACVSGFEFCWVIALLRSIENCYELLSWQDHERMSLARVSGTLFSKTHLMLDRGRPRRAKGSG